MMYFSYCPTIN